MTQALLAWKLGITDKAVSKWENGRSRPSLPQLQKLALLYNLPIEELLAAQKENDGMQITKIVITGGPCAGKTTGMGRIQKEFVKLGYKVLFVPETATELITGGVAPWTLVTNEEYQKCQVSLQKRKEEIFEQAAGKMGAEKVLIVCDRGVMDNRAYMNDLEFENVMRALGLHEVEERDQYDAVFHLTTAAKGALQAYTLSNNGARTETPEEAIAVDDRLIAAWTGHPHFRVIDNSTSFEEKMSRLVAEIASFLGEPVPLEIERKFLIRYPDLAALEEKPNCEKVEIIQTYLRSSGDTEVRVRQRGKDGKYMYYRTKKTRVSETERTEIERRISQEEYVGYLMEADPARRPIRKTRYCLTENNCYYEIDIYPEWKKQAILEVELRTTDQEIIFPQDIKVIREVTADKTYGNHSLAAEMPEED